MDAQNISVEPVLTAQQQEEFLRLPWSIYGDDKNWAPPPLDFQRELLFLDRHPFHQIASYRSWIASTQGQTVGRITAILNQSHLEFHSDQTAFFGFFESVDCPNVASALVKQAKAWLAEKGIRRIQGPVSPSIHYEAGMLLQPCDPFFTSSYNPSYYPRLMDDCGLALCQTMRSYSMHVDLLDRLDNKIYETAQRAAERFNIRLRHFDIDHLEDDLQTYFGFYNKTLQSMWGFTPISNEEIEHQLPTWQKIIIPELTVIAEIDGSPVGTACGFLDYNPILRQNDGQLFKQGEEQLRQDRKKLKQARIFSAHVLPQYERWGIGPAMLMFLLPAGLQWGLEQMESSWIEESNHLSNQSMLRAGAKPRAEYGFYESAW